MMTNLWVRRSGRIAVMLAAALLLAGAAPQSFGAQPATAEVRVEASVDSDSVRIVARGSAPFEYTTYRPSDSLFVVDFTGTSPATAGGARVLKSDIVSSYRVMQYRAGDRAIVRLEVLMRTVVEPRVERVDQDTLAIVFASRSEAAARPAERPVPVRASAPVTRVVSATAPASARSATLINDVKITRVDQQTRVEILGNGRLAYEALRLNNPDRLVLDFSGARIATKQKTVTSTTDPVRGIRLGQFTPAIGRVVIDLAAGVAYSVSAEDRSVYVSFGSEITAARTQPSAAPAAPEVVAAAVEPPVKEKEIDTKIAAPHAPAATEVRPVAAPALTGVNLSLPDALTKSSAMLASPAAKLEPPAAPAASPEPQQQAAPSGPSATRYSGDPIAVNFKDIDLKDFFRLIHEISGLNVVVDPNVRGSLTLVLDDVPWDQALDIVLKNNSLDKQLEGNVLRIATKATLKKEAEERRDLAKAEEESQPRENRLRTLSYAKATAMRDTLKRFLSPRGEVLADERSNTVIIREIPTNLPALWSLMDQLDRRAQQVEIEARVVAASRTFAREIGTQFGFATSAAGGRTVFGGLVGRSTFVSPVERGPALPPAPLVASGTNSIPLNTNFPANAPTSGVTFAHASPNLAIDFIISAAESKGVGKLISKPKVITQNNLKGTVKQGTKIPIQTVINNTISVQFTDAVLKLEVTPQITADGNVFMEVLVENTQIDDGIPRISGIPALTTQMVENTVMIGDGGTVVIGGIIVSSQRTDVSQVPLLGSIPVIGHLFKRTAVSSASQELLFFLTPRVVPSI